MMSGGVPVSALARYVLLNPTVICFRESQKTTQTISEEQKTGLQDEHETANKETLSR